MNDLKNITVEVGLQTETGYPHSGTLDYVAPSVSQSTGTLAGARHPAKRRPGAAARLFRARASSARRSRTSLLVPDVALGSDQGGRYVLIANKDNVVEQRKVEIGPLVDTMRVIESGLTAEDRVIVSGLLRAVPGEKVDPQTQPRDDRCRAAADGPAMIAKFFIERPVLANVSPS